MSKFKASFIKNSFSMLIIIITIMFGIFIINNYKKKENKNFQIGGSFQLIKQNGDSYSSKLINKKKVIYFGYTFCPDVCPIDLLKISRIIAKQPNLVEDFDFIFITVDPERDNQSQIKNFMSNFNENLIGLTGEVKDIDNVLSMFRIYVKRNKNFNDENYLV